MHLIIPYAPVTHPTALSFFSVLVYTGHCNVVSDAPYKLTLHYIPHNDDDNFDEVDDENKEQSSVFRHRINCIHGNWVCDEQLAMVLSTANLHHISNHAHAPLLQYIYRTRMIVVFIYLQLTKRMAIANGTCDSFCNQPIKAHFGLPGYAPGTIAVNVIWMKKRIQCLSNASQHIPIYLQLFPSNSTRKFKSSPFSTFFAHFGLPGYAPPGKIAVDVTWMERGFNAGQTHSRIHPSIFNRLRAIARYWSEIATFSYPLPLDLTSP